MGSILAFRGASARGAGHSNGGGGHSHTAPHEGYPQGVGSASGYPQGRARRLKTRGARAIVGA